MTLEPPRLVGVPPALERALFKALAKKPADRFQGPLPFREASLEAVRELPSEEEAAAFLEDLAALRGAWLANLPGKIAEFEEAADAPKRLRRLAHSRHGTAACYGLLDLAEAARRLEHAAEADAPGCLEALVRAIRGLSD